MSEFEIAVDGQISIGGKVTPYFYRSNPEHGDELWREEDPFFGTRFKRLTLPRRTYGTSEGETMTLRRDVEKILAEEGWDF